MGNGKKLLLLLLVAALLCGGYFAVKHFIQTDESDDASAEEGVPVAAMQTDDVAGIRYVCGDETIELEKAEDTWFLKADREFPVDQALADTMAADAATLEALRLVSENADDLAQYGLDTPDTAYVFTLSDGTQVTYFIGNYNSFGNSYYMNVAGTEQIYLISGDLLDDFGHSMSELADVEDMPSVSTDEIHDLTLTLDGETTRLLNRKDGLPTVYSDMFIWFLDKQTPADPTVSQTLVGDAADFTSNGCADYKAQDDELAAYGLDEPALTAKFGYTMSVQLDTGKTDDDGEPVKETVEREETLTLFVGGASKDGSLYAKTDKSDVVYLIDASYLQTLREIDRTTLRNKRMCAVELAEVDAMDVTIGDKTLQISVTHSETDDDIENNVYKADGKTLDTERFNDFYAAIQSVQAEAFADKTVPTDDALIDVTFHTSRKGFETMRLRIVPYDRNFYVADLSGSYGALINKRDAEKIMQTFEDIGE